MTQTEEEQKGVSIYTCQTCGLTFTTHQECIDHIKTEHKENL